MKNTTRFNIALALGLLSGVLMSIPAFVPHWHHWTDKTLYSVIHIPAIGFMSAWDKLGLPAIGSYGRWDPVIHQTLFVIVLQWGGSGALVGWICCWLNNRRRGIEQGAPPNGGPATPPGKSGVTEGPPSVS